MATEDERSNKIKHNEEVREKMNSEKPGMLGDGYVAHHEARCGG